MARIRTIKPDFWVDEKIVELSAWARLLFIALWNFCDDSGRIEYRVKKIKMQVFPADSVDISELLGEIRRESLIEIYAVENKEYLQILNFSKHQKVDRRTPSKFPDKHGNYETPAESPPRKGREGKGKEGSVRFRAPSVEEVSEYCKQRGNSIDPQSFVDYYQARGWKLKTGPMKDWQAAVRTWENRDSEKPAKKDVLIWN